MSKERHRSCDIPFKMKVIETAGKKSKKAAYTNVRKLFIVH